MKKILLFLSLIVLSVTSCTSDETETSTVPQTTSVVATIATPSSSTTGKNVNRGNIFAWVKDINVTANSTVWSYSTNTVFNLVPTGGASNFIIDNVAVGANQFVANTTTNSSEVYSLTVVSTGTASALKTSLVAHNPYALYNGSTNTVISNGTTNVVNLAMQTTHGRIISIFQFDEDVQLRANTEATITAEVNGKAVLTSAKFSNTGLVAFEWSDATSIVGKEVKFTVKVYDKNGTKSLLKTYTVTSDKIKASTSTSCIYDITRDQIINTTDEVKFTWQPWVEEDCEDTYDNDGYNCKGYNNGGFDKCGWHKAPNVFYNAQQDKDLSDGNSHAKCN